MSTRRFLALAGILLASCSGSADVVDVPSLFGVVEQDPTGNAPLTARIAITAPRDLSVTMTIVAKAGGDEDYVRTFSVPVSDVPFQIPILGLYPAHQNLVEFQVADTDGKVLGTHTVGIASRARRLPRHRNDRDVRGR